MRIWSIFLRNVAVLSKNSKIIVLVAVVVVCFCALFAAKNIGTSSAFAPSDWSFSGIENKTDERIMAAFLALDEQNYDEALKIYKEEFARTGDLAYLKEALGTLMLKQDYEAAKLAAQDFLAKSDDEEVRQVYIGILTNLQEFDLAAEQADLLLKNKESEQNLELASSVRFLQSNYRGAADYLERAYNIEKNEILLDKLCAIYMLFLRDRFKAISLYESHIRNYGISRFLGEKLAIVYIENKDYLSAARIYEKLFVEFSAQEYAGYALEIYFKNGNLYEAQAFLEKYENIASRDEALLEIYRRKKDNKKAIELLGKLYSDRGDVNFLGMQAMLMYEEFPKTKDNLEKTEKLLREVIEKSEDHIYLNYLGYMLIDHDINIKEGVELVEKALEKDPQNVYYLDSLAWGYYKQKEYKKALETIEKIPEIERNKEVEITAHYKAILSANTNSEIAKH